MADADDRDLLRRHAAGDSAAFPALYRKYYPRVHGYCARLLSANDQVEDVVQNVFSKAFETIHRLESPDLFRYWLFAIARNETYAVFRTSKRKPTVALDDDVWDSRTPFDAAVESETAALVEIAIGHLKPEYREVILLRQFEGLSYAEIAAITGDTISAVESRLFKARRTLVKYLQPLFREPEEP